MDASYVRIEEILITKVKKTRWKVLIEPKYKCQKQNLQVHVANQFILGYPACICGGHGITRAPGIFTKYWQQDLAGVKAIM